MALSLTTIPDSFGKGGANIGDGDPVLSAVLQEHKTALETLDQAQAVAGNVPTLKRTVTVTYADDLAGLGAGVKSFAKNIGDVLPANARFEGVEMRAPVAISGGAVVTASLSVGVTGAATAITTATDVKAGTLTGFPKPGPAGPKGYPMCSLSGLQLVATVATDIDLKNLAAGALAVDVFYTVLA